MTVQQLKEVVKNRILGEDAKDLVVLPPKAFEITTPSNRLAGSPALRVKWLSDRQN
jgi:hypothetical protein